MENLPLLYRMGASCLARRERSLFSGGHWDWSVASCPFEQLVETFKEGADDERDGCQYDYCCNRLCHTC